MKTFLKVIGILIAIVVIVGLFLDNKVNVTREVIIKAQPEYIHQFVNDLNEWPKWTPWLESDPTIKTTTGAITKGVGAKQAWQGESGSGQLTYTQSSPKTGIVYTMTFDGDPTVYTAGMRYEPVSDGTTKVIWFMEGEMKPIIIGNYFAQMMDMFVGSSFQNGLNKLKKVAEE